jgi:gliding motility-associated-like protein
MLKATHLIGGEMTYTCLGYNVVTDEYTYEIYLIVYRDCGPNNELGTFFDSTASIGVFQNGVSTQFLAVDYPGSFTLIDTQVDDSCSSFPSQACVQKAEYITVVNLKFNGEPFDLTYQRCCRSPGTNNLIIPEELGTTLTVNIPVPQDGICNSSPYFNQLPPAFLCLDKEMELDFSATDPDGDQLIYSLCTPLTGGSTNDPKPTPWAPPYFEVSWKYPYSELIPFNASPAVSINPTTGLLTGVPTQQGIFSIGICVSEYRNGELIGSILRDYQIFIYLCPTPTSVFAEESSIQFCQGTEITFENLSVNSQTFFWDFGIDSILSDTSNEFQPTYSFPAEGTYEVMLIVNPGYICADTSFHVFFVQPEITVDFEYSGPNCGDVITYTFVPSGTLDVGNFIWNFGNDVISTDVIPPDILYPDSGNYDVFLTYNINGCSGFVLKQLYVYPEVVAEITPQSESCIGLKLVLNNESKNADYYKWTIIRNDFQFVSDEIEPEIQVLEQGLYNVQLIALRDSTCPDTTYETFAAYPLMFPEFTLTDDTLCFENNSINFLAGGIFGANAGFLWDFGENSNIQQSSNQNNQDIQYSEPGVYPVSLSIFENGCLKTYTDSFAIYPNPEALFYISDTSGCMPLSVQFVDNSLAWTPLNYSWSFDDGNSSAFVNPTNEFILNGNYLISLTINTTNGCIGQDVFQFPLPIEVFPLPVANFEADPQVVKIEDPKTYISNLAEGEINVFYIINNLDTIVDEDFIYSFDEGGMQQIIQIAENEFACIDSIKIIVSVEGYLFFIPNAFTPDNNGVNDVLYPIVVGVEAFKMKIYNRWGELAFESNDVNQGWDGNDAEVGVYNYVVIIFDESNNRYRFTGSVLLVR